MHSIEHPPGQVDVSTLPVHINECCGNKDMGAATKDEHVLVDPPALVDVPHAVQFGRTKVKGFYSDVKMSSALPTVPTSARSMLEEMLAALKLRDEKPKDVPPSLPSRPTLKRRPPSTKNKKFKIESDLAEFSSEEPADVTVVKARPDLSEPRNGIILSNRPDEQDSQESDSYEEAHFVEEALVDDASRLEELEKLVTSIKEELRQKEEENIALLAQVQEYQKNWSLCEEKIHSMEDLYQKQIQTLTMSLDVVQKSLLASDTAKQLAGAGPKPDATPNKNVVGRNVDCKGITCPVYQLAKELEKQKQMFEVEARGLGDVKSGQTEYAKKSLEELRKLKAVYASWKKEYKKHLHETKKALLKLKKSEGEETHRRWWCQRRTAKSRFSMCSS
ncbi:hypothetical protein ZIOFF_001584 [Zingiber officinale]|uniref:Uncharacterized protein n=1 Tax=Zingiber officinale TaxID=94328 RepID=A0A8J5I3S7_ZINOF|nr:hypothetical protein ZIOFF_001584 [Zingiber officinale]